MTGSYLLFVKESGLIIFGLSALWIIWNLMAKEKPIKSSVIFVTSCVIASAACYSVLVYSSGGIEPYLEIYKHIKEVVGTSLYGKEYQSGPWLNFITGLWLISPLSLVLYIVGAAGTLLPFEHKTYRDIETRRAACWLILFSVIFFSMFIILPDSQNYRFVSVVFAPFYLIAGLGLWKILLSLKPFVKETMIVVVPAVAAAIIFAAIWDYQTFGRIVSGCGAIDMAVKNIISYSK